MDSALMPGSKTPKPPGCQIQSWFGCQRRTSSFQLIAAERIVVPARKAAGGLDGGRIARMPAGEQRDALVVGQPLQVLDFADGGAGRLFHEDVLAGLDGRARRLVAVLAAACRAIRRRWPVRRPASASIVAKLAMPSTVALRLAAATRSKSRLPATAGRCWSRTILPTPTMASLMGVFVEDMPLRRFR